MGSRHAPVHVITPLVSPVATVVPIKLDAVPGGAGNGCPLEINYVRKEGEDGALLRRNQTRRPEGRTGSAKYQVAQSDGDTSSASHDMKKRSMFVGMDVHKESIDISVAERRDRRQPRRRGQSGQVRARATNRLLSGSVTR